MDEIFLQLFNPLQYLNGLVSGMLLFIMAAGLSLIFGQMNVINLTHGGFYLIGSYIGYSMVTRFDNFWLALLIAPIVVGILGIVIERFLLSRFYGGNESHLKQVLLTFGMALIIADFIEWQWGATPLAFDPPELLGGTLPIFGVSFPIYRLALIGFGLLLALALWLFLERSRIGAIIRAGVSDATMVSGLGININRVFTGVFVFGTMLAALAGVIGAPVFALRLGLDFDILVLTLVVVVLGGLGTLKGAFWGALIIGMADTLGKAIIPQFSLFIIFAVMAVVLLIRPAGLFGLEGQH
ncbi:MAG: branched-chain amino acid ABC transporter permease [Chloroflexota bacterium]